METEKHWLVQMAESVPMTKAEAALDVIAGALRCAMADRAMPIKQLAAIVTVANEATTVLFSRRMS